MSGRPWSLWARQTLAILRLEVKKSFLSKRALPIYVLALLPVAALGLRAVALLHLGTGEPLPAATTLYATIFQSFILRFVVFFGCMVIFTNLFRGEILERTLHYYFLTPVRRDVLVFGKYVSGLLTAIGLFAGSTAFSLVLFYVPHGVAAARDHLLGGPGLGHVLAYLAVTALGCLGYGAVFLALGLLFRNPILPGIAILGWESIGFLLPPALKKISVIHYLVSLCPVPVSEGAVALIAEPTPAWLGVPGLLLVTLLVLLVAGLRIRRTEIIYGAD